MFLKNLGDVSWQKKKRLVNFYNLSTEGTRHRNIMAYFMYNFQMYYLSLICNTVWGKRQALPLFVFSKLRFPEKEEKKRSTGNTFLISLKNMLVVTFYLCGSIHRGWIWCWCCREGRDVTGVTGRKRRRRGERRRGGRSRDGGESWGDDWMKGKNKKETKKK